MRDFPSCFGENGVQVADSSSSSSSSSSNASKNAHNLVSNVYQCCISGKTCLLTITWSRNMMGQGLSIGIDDSEKNQCLCKVDIKPWLFSKRKGSKNLEAYSTKIDVYWDLSSAKFGSGPEPLEGFYVCIVMDNQMILLLGDMKREAYKKTNAVPFPFNAVFVAKRVNVFGKKVFGTKAKFNEDGKVHDLVIDCDTLGVKDPCLVIRINGKTTMQVKRLRWKFRGNHTILVDGMSVEVFWDVHNWLFGTPLGIGNAVFMFKTSVLSDKMWVSQPLSSESGMLQWSCSQRFKDSTTRNLGFSLVLSAWKNE